MSKELYAPALGGIMLSIGIRLSIDDFGLAFKRLRLFLAMEKWIFLWNFRSDSSLDFGFDLISFKFPSVADLYLYRWGL